MERRAVLVHCQRLEPLLDVRRQVARVAQGERSSQEPVLSRWDFMRQTSTQPLQLSKPPAARTVSNKPTKLMGTKRNFSSASLSRAESFFFSSLESALNCASGQPPRTYFFPRVLCGAAVKINMLIQHLVRGTSPRQAPPREQAGKSHGRECPTGKAKQVNFVARAAT